MNKLAIKFVVSLITLCLTAGLLTTTVLAATGTAEANTDALKNLEFNVKQHLSLGQMCEKNDDCPLRADGTNYSCESNCPPGSEDDPLCKIKYCDVQSLSYFGKEADEDKRTAFPIFRFILDIIETLTKIAGTIAVIMLILTGFVMMFSQGNQNLLEKAKQMFVHVLIGMIAILLSYVVITLVQSIFTL